MHALIERVRGERGIALAVTMLTLMVLSTLAGILLYTSTVTSQSSVTDRSGKAALATANAGLQTAIYRLSNATPTSTSSGQCFTTTWASLSSGVCPGQQESYGTAPNGGSFTYYVSPVLLSTNSVPFQPADCTGYPIVSNGEVIAQRCVTAVGTVNGVTRRVQERVVGGTKFYVNGIVSLGAMDFTNTLTMTGDLGANGTINFNNTTSVNGNVTYVPPSTVTGHPCTPCTEVSQSQAYATPGTNDQAYASAYTSNKDATGVTWPGGGNCTTTNYYLSCATVVGSAASPVTFQAGTYYYCGWSFTNQVYMAVASNVSASNPVLIYIDSPNRSGSVCSTGTGTVSLTNSMSFSNPSQDPTSFEIDAYGNPTGTLTPFKFTNSLNSCPANPFYGMIYAPFSAWSTTNTVCMAGSIVAGSFSATNKVTFTGQGGGTSGRAFPVYASAYTQCPSKNSGDPGAGCY